MNVRRCPSSFLRELAYLFLVGLHFAILIVWVMISCVTLTLIQCYAKREGSEKTARLDQDMKV